MSETIKRPLYVAYEYHGNGMLPGSGRTVLMVTRVADEDDQLTFEDINEIEKRAASQIVGGVKDGKLFLTWWQWLRPSASSPAPSPNPYPVTESEMSETKSDDWFEELNLSEDALGHINGDPALLSLLYDLDLLPEQLASQDEKTPGLIKAYHRLYGVIYGYLAFRDMPARITAPEPTP